MQQQQIVVLRIYAHGWKYRALCRHFPFKVLLLHSHLPAAAISVNQAAVRWQNHDLPTLRDDSCICPA